MATYDFRKIEKKWQDYWKKNSVFTAEKLSDKPKFYALDMFPYPSGKGLHVGHPLGYIATDIVARYKWLKGYNVLHPMGFDAFGLPAEQYAIQTGTHPAETTEKNIQRYKEQLDILGMAYDPETELRTSDPEYYKWTQWIFLQLFKSWYDKDQDKARPVEELTALFAKGGSGAANAFSAFEGEFSAAGWQQMNEKQQQEILLKYRLAYIDYAMVNWCPALGTVLANDEVVNGVSERGGHPVVRKSMRQWFLRMTAYADRLLKGLDTIDWPEPLKEMQRNWIGRSEGALIRFPVSEGEGEIEVFSTRPDTIYGATFLVLAPEHELVPALTSAAKKADVENYVQRALNKSEVERMSDAKTMTGVFTGGYAIHPFSGDKVPVWVADYVLGGYGTGAVMAVPAHDSRDHAFAQHFNLPIVQVVDGPGANVEAEAFDAKEGKMINSDEWNGMDVKDAIRTAIDKIVEFGLGHAEVNYKLRDPNFSRQRYWGEPFPIVFRDGLPYALDESELPLELPHTDDFQPSGSGESPLAKLEDWVNLPDGSIRETNTMPGYAGSSWYFFRYPDAGNDAEFVAPEKEQYWLPVDLYIGGSEHAVGHLLYSRFWGKFLHDIGKVRVDEPFQKLVNQGMIQGVSAFGYAARVFGSNVIIPKSLGRRINDNDNEAVAYFSNRIREYLKEGGPFVFDPKDEAKFPLPTDVEEFIENEYRIRIDVSYLDSSDNLKIEEIRNDPLFRDHIFIPDSDGSFKLDREVERMSKSKLNVVNPDDICERYGADTFRMYEMFLGPLEMSKPWNTNGIEGVFKFLKKLWGTVIGEDGEVILTDEEPTADELRVLHQTIKKVGEDIEKLSFNTSVPQFMIFQNEMGKMNCRKRAIYEPFLIVLAPFAPHIAEESWSRLGHKDPVSKAEWPSWEEKFLKEQSIEYPVQVNGKVKAKVHLSADLTKEELEKEVMNLEEVKLLVADKQLRKLIVVPGRIINLVVG